MELINLSSDVKLIFCADDLEESKFLKTLISLNFVCVDIKELPKEHDISSIIKNETNKHQEPINNVRIDNNRIPNNLTSISNRYKKSIVDEHTNMENAELVSVSDLNIDNTNEENITILKNFTCPDCLQSALASVMNNNDQILEGYKYIISIPHFNKNILCVLDKEMQEEIDLLIEKSFNVSEENKVIQHVFAKLATDNTNIVGELADIVIKVSDELVNTTILKCPRCNNTNTVNEWVSKQREVSCDNLCHYCGDDMLIDVNECENKCSNKHCYSNHIK